MVACGLGSFHDHSGTTGSLSFRSFVCLCVYLLSYHPGMRQVEARFCHDSKTIGTFKLNAERQNGRAAMLGIVGMIIHEALGVDALYPTGGGRGNRRLSDNFVE